MSDVEALIAAIKTGDTARARSMAEAMPQLAAARLPSGETPVMTALYHGQQDLAAAFADAAGPLDLFAAAALGRRDALDAAIRESDLNAFSYDGWTALHLAAFFGQLEAASQLVGAGAAVDAISRNSMQNTPLHAACAGSHTAIALLLLERGADATIVDAGRHTPLHIAAENGLADVVRALLSRGADPYAVDAEDRTPIARAAARNRNEIVDLLNEAS